MDLFKRVLLFPSKQTENSFSYLYPASLVYILPPYIERGLESFLTMGSRDFFGMEVLYGFFPPEGVFPEVSDVVEDIKNTLEKDDSVIILFGPHYFLEEVHKAIKDSYFHQPEEEDKEYLIEFYPCLDSGGFIPEIRVLTEIEKICLQ